MALADAGVPLVAPVAGTACAVLMGENGDSLVLADPSMAELEAAQLELRIAGTADAITASWVRTSMPVPIEVLEAAVARCAEDRPMAIAAVATIPVRPDRGPSTVTLPPLNPNQRGRFMGSQRPLAHLVVRG